MHRFFARLRAPILTVLLAPVAGCDNADVASKSTSHPPTASIGERIQIDTPGDRIAPIQKHDDQPDVTAAITILPMERNQPVVIVPVTIDATQYWFLLDTGATAHVFDASLRDKLGPLQQRVTVESPAGSVAAEVFAAPLVSLGDVELDRRNAIACLDLTSMRKAIRCDLRGVIGMPFFDRFIVQLDWDNHTVAILPSTTPPSIKWGQRIDAPQVAGDGMAVKCILGDHQSRSHQEPLSATFLIDTGYYGGPTIRERYSRLLKNRRSTFYTHEIGSIVFGGHVIRKSGRLRHFSLGPFHHSDLEIRSDSICKLGVKYLSRYRVTIDRPNNRVFLRPSKKYGHRYVYEHAGLFVQWIDGHFTVIHEEPKAVAFLAGIRTGDTIEKVSGRPASDFTLATLYDWFQTRQGGPITISCRRNGELHQFSFQLKEQQFDYDVLKE
ncbi:MAG: aspartyl protease family protein [Planctomycetes bacterium]|nr:aspartyl protease family protein [Planctomycetota bacterium]